MQPYLLPTYKLIYSLVWHLSVLHFAKEIILKWKLSFSGEPTKPTNSKCDLKMLQKDLLRN